MKSLILLLCLISLSAQASFEEGYMSPQDLILALNGKFKTNEVAKSCGSIEDLDRSALGDINPASGDIANTAPGASFLVWYDGCITKYFEVVHYGKDTTFFENVLGNQFRHISSAMNTSSFALYSALWSVKFDKLSDSDRREIISNALAYILGSDEEILAYGRIRDVNKYKEDLLAFLQKSSDQSLTNILPIVVRTLLKRDEFLMY